MNGDLLTPEQAADRLNWSRKTIYRWLAAGWLPGAEQLPNGRWRIPASALPTPQDAA